MFTRIHYAFYNMLFELYGKRCKRYSHKAMVDELRRPHWERQLRKCVEIREDILQIMFTLKGLN